jgi:exosortase
VGKDVPVNGSPGSELQQSKSSGAGRPVPVGPLLVLAGLGLLLLWVYWPALEAMAQQWSRNPQYSHGFLVPLFALALLRLRREQLATASFQWNWWGVPLVVLGTALNLAGAYWYIDWLGGASLLPCLAGIALLLGGWPALRCAWPAIAFLAFMLPLPFAVEQALGMPLRTLATRASTWSLQTLGVPALEQGNIIIVKTHKIGVAEACSGLSMLLTFAAISTAVAIVIRRPLLDKLLLLVSAIPIALLANVARITATGILIETAGSQVAQAFFHDFAGWLMMPLAVGLLWVELRVLSRLLVERPLGPLAIAGSRSQTAS